MLYMSSNTLLVCFEQLKHEKKLAAKEAIQDMTLW